MEVEVPVTIKARYSDAIKVPMTTIWTTNLELEEIHLGDRAIMRRIAGEEVKESVFKVGDKEYDSRDEGVKSVAQEYEEEQEE